MREITIPLLPPSVNTYWRRGARSTYLSKKGREHSCIIIKKIQKKDTSM